MGFLIMLLLMQKLLPVPGLQSQHVRSVPEDFIAPLELQQKQFGLVDDYGLKPRHPKLQIRKQRKESETLHRTHKSKRDEPNFEEYYYDDLF
ncbi:protein Frey 1 [Ahaetulla prasina]|uniref:protein Frey 1 n=1 Tax=Ahaetulla prasina TaxID=499056 RepID=UPI0026481328|nr:protein Frey 1 [Ahaetulla prasina]